MRRQGILTLTSNTSGVLNGDYLDQVIDDWNREMPSMETIGLATIGRIFAIYKHLEDSVDNVLKEYGLPLWGFDVLFALRRQGPPYSLMPTQLMKACFLTSGAVTHRLDRLEGLGLIERSHSTNDRRGVLITLLEPGKELVERALPARINHITDVLAPLSRAEQDQLAHLLRKLLCGIEARG